MKTFKRDYTELKLFGGQKRDAELELFSENEDDFNFRRLYIEEQEKWLHIIFSRSILSKWISVGLIALSVCYFQYHTLSLILFITSFMFLLASLILKRKFRIKVDNYQFGLNLVNIVISDTHGISF